MELWDAYTKEEALAGKTLVRGEPIPEGLYHLVCEVLVRHRDGSVLCMKRSMKKPNDPGWYEATCGGSALMGENALQCIRRELNEETGLCCAQFTPIARHRFEEERCIFYSFACTVDCDKASVVLQPGETEGYCWMTEEAFRAFVCSERMIPRQKYRYRSYFLELGYLPDACNAP